MWIIYSLTTAIILASRKVQEKNLVWSVGWALGWMIRVGSWIGALILWILFSRDYTWVTDWRFLLLLAGVIFLFYPLYTIGYYYALQRMELSLFGMLAPVAILSNVLFSWLVFGSIPSLFGWIGIGLISLSIITLFYRNKAKWDITSLVIALGTYILLGISSGLDKIGISYISPYLYTTLNQFGAALSLFILSFFLFSGPHLSFAQKNYKMILGIGIVQWVGWAIGMLAIQSTPNPWYAVALMNTHAIMTVIYGVVVFWESFTRRKQVILWLVTLSLVAFAMA